jgi:pilus assembly protein Flp/PilA
MRPVYLAVIAVMWKESTVLKVYAWLESLKAREAEGQGLVEYALIIALVSVMLVGALAGLRGGIEGVFGDIVGAFSGA